MSLTVIQHKTNNLLKSIAVANNRYLLIIKFTQTRNRVCYTRLNEKRDPASTVKYKQISIF